MHKGSDRYFIQNLIAKPAFFYSAGAAITASLRLFALYLGMIGQIPNGGPEQIEIIVLGSLDVLLPVIVGGITPGDILLVALNIAFGVMLAGWWTVKWSNAMSS